MVATSLRRLPAIDQGGGEVDPDRPGADPHERCLHELAFPGPVPDPEGGQHGGEEGKAGRVIPLPGARLDREPIGLAQEPGHSPATEERGDIEGQAVGVWPGRALAADQPVDQPGVVGQQFVGAEPVALEPEPGEVGDHDVGSCHQRGDDLPSSRVAQIDSKGTLATVVELEDDVGALDPLGPARLAELVTHRVARRRLDLNDGGAHVGHEHGRTRTGHPVGDLDDDQVVQRAAHGGLRRTAYPRSPPGDQPSGCTPRIP